MSLLVRVGRFGRVELGDTLLKFNQSCCTVDCGGIELPDMKLHLGTEIGKKYAQGMGSG